MGEAGARDRPTDSVLDKHLEFEFAGKAAEPMTETVNIAIEDLIRQRIIDEAWDDVERKDEPTEKAFKPRMELNQDKSKEGLAEIYEKQYLEMARTDGGTEEDDKLTQEHKEISEDYARLCYKLDSLSNFHFAPKRANLELNIVSHAPAIDMEEIIPMGVSTAVSVAPQDDFKSTQQGKPITSEEMERTEKQAKRRGNKRRHRKRKRVEDAEEKQRENLANKDKDYTRAPTEKLTKAGMKAVMNTVMNSRNITQGQDSGDMTSYSHSKDFFATLEGRKKQGDVGKKDKKQKVSAKANWKL